jgi:hypothetical protein
VPMVGSKVAALLVASAMVLFTAACGSTGSAGSGGGGSAGNGTFAAYADCLKKNGVTITLPSGGPRVRPSGGRGLGAVPSGMPRPSGNAGRGGSPGGGFDRPAGVDDATWRKAQAACASVRPSFGPGSRGSRGNGADRAYLTCLRDHGVTPGQETSTSDPTVAKAVQTCKVLRPTASPTPTPTS